MKLMLSVCCLFVRQLRGASADRVSEAQLAAQTSLLLCRKRIHCNERMVAWVSHLPKILVATVFQDSLKSLDGRWRELQGLLVLASRRAEHQ
mmetsp:Transcript_12861/g.30136  ORF Transcript_12861/g.30136 Transcript_12861/m.30136 type:complete len:92 (+) Transcript_12861:68-343(+)